jgi:hypothetical protein
VAVLCAHGLDANEMLSTCGPFDTFFDELLWETSEARGNFGV